MSARERRLGGAMKRAHPELYCQADARCLWALSSGACPRHGSRVGGPHQGSPESGGQHGRPCPAPREQVPFSLSAGLEASAREGLEQKSDSSVGNPRGDREGGGT